MGFSTPLIETEPPLPSGSAGNYIRDPFVIGIAGGSGAGKTTVVKKLRAQLSAQCVSVVDLDSYYKDQSHLSEAQRAGLNFDDPAVLDFDLLLFHLRELRLGKRIAKPVYCFATHTRTCSVNVIEPARFVIVEGIFALHDPRLRSLMDLKIYIEADADLRFIRRLKRDIVSRGRTAESVIKQYLETVRPMYVKHIAPTREYADLLVDCTGSLGRAMHEINAAMRSAVSRHAVKANATCEATCLR